MPKIAVLGLLLELTGGLVGFDLAKDASVWTETLMLVAVVSLVLGSVLGLAQARIKRLLTYSTISHIGFLLLTLTAYSVDGVTSFLFYLIQYSLTSLATLSVLLAFGYVRDRYPLSDLELISQLTGRIATQPLLSLGLASLLFSMAGIPPFIGFFAKQAVLETSLVAHYGGIAVLAILVSVISASYYLKVVRLMSFTSLDVKTPSLSLTLDTVSQPLAATHTFILSILILIVSLYALLPSTFLDSIRVLALMMALD